MPTWQIDLSAAVSPPAAGAGVEGPARRSRSGKTPNHPPVWMKQTRWPKALAARERVSAKPGGHPERAGIQQHPPSCRAKPTMLASSPRWWQGARAPASCSSHEQPARLPDRVPAMFAIDTRERNG